MNNQTMATRGQPRPSANSKQQGPTNRKWPPSTPKLQEKGSPSTWRTNNPRIHTLQGQKQKTRKRGKIDKKKEGETLEILYANANGILGKIGSLQVVANLTNSHEITLTETKSTPPNLEGYAPWITKNRKGKTGGVAIATRQDITNNT